MLLRLVIAIALAPFLLAQARPGLHPFDGDRPGAPPAGFTFAAMRQPEPGAWLIRRVADGGVLVHAAANGARGLSIALAPGEFVGPVLVSARMRLAGGSRAGGLVWRYRDPENFHAAMVDLVERELVLFRVTGGNRVFLESEDGLELDPDAWHTLKIEHDDNEIEVALGGIRVFEERDRRGSRTSDGVRAGVVAAGHADVWFDDLRLERRRQERR
jgi:hypothetical protein